MLEDVQCDTTRHVSRTCSAARSQRVAIEEKNPLVDLMVSPDGRGLEMTWASLQTPHVGILNMTVRASVVFTDAGLVRRNHIENRSAYPRQVR